MKTAEEWMKEQIKDRQGGDVSMCEVIEEVQLDARAELLVELDEKTENFQRKVDWCQRLVVELEQAKKGRDDWKRLAEKFKYHSTHGASCDSYVDQDDEDCTCGLTTLRAEFEKKGNQP